MKKNIAFGFISVFIIVLFASKPPLAEGLPAKNLVKMKNITTQIPTKTPQIVQNLSNTLRIAKQKDAELINLKELRTIGNRSQIYVLHGSRWTTKNLTYKIINYPKGLKKSDVDTEIARAFNVWSKYSMLNFTAKPNGSVHIDISFDDIENGDPFDGPGKVVARSYYPIGGGDVFFDIAENWTVGKRGGVNLFQAAAHEFGHCLGLSHTKNQSALMAAQYRGFDAKFKLSEGDILGIQALYGKRNGSS